MGWLSAKIGNWATNTQARELEQFVARLSSMDSDEIAMIVALATDRRHKIAEMYGWNLLDPNSIERADPFAAVKLSQIIKQLQKDGNPIVAAALMVWIHTLRAGTSLDLRQLGRSLWKQLSRGFAHVAEAEIGFQSLGGQSLNLDGYDQFPIGLTPEPL